MPKKPKFDISLQPSFDNIITQYVLSTGLNPEEFASKLEAESQKTVSPDEILGLLSRFIESAFSKQNLFKTLNENNNVLQLLLSLFENSRFLSEILIREPNLLFWVLDKNVISQKKSSAQFEVDIETSISIYNSVNKKIDAIKRFFRHNILRIGVKDLFFNSDLEEITSELSALADSIIKIITDISIRELESKYGKIPKTDFTIFGLGKLGGNELNYSSDIDLIMAYKEDGEFKTRDKRVVFYFDYFQELGRNIIKLLSETTQEGYLYRVDMRLRPEGSSGPLVPSYSYLLSYYESRGEIWERQMLIKARAIFNQNGFGDEILKNLTSFIYPKYPLKNPLEEIAKIKFKIESGGDRSANIKLRAGGVRDIEFSVQALQLLNGGKTKSVREKNTLLAIECLLRADLLSPTEAKLLRNAYIFYRMVEHRLQIRQYHQTFTLPNERNELLKLSRMMNFSNEKKFNRKLETYINNIRKIFNKIFKIDIKENLAEIERIILSEPDIAVGLLSKYGLNNPESLRYFKLLVFGSAESDNRKYPKTVTDLAKHILSVSFRHINKLPNRMQLLRNLEYLVSNRVDVEAFLRLLNNEDFCKIILTICAYSTALTKMLSQDEKILELVYNFGNNLTDLDELQSIRLIQKYKFTLFQLVILDLAGKLKKGEIHSEISRHIENIIAEVVNTIEAPNGFKMSIIALGKLGSREMGINSDLDLMFVFRITKADGSEQALGFFERFIKEFSSKTEGFFEIDLRLRPEGKNAPIAIEESAFIEYLQSRASLWEKLALTRARVIAGDELLGSDLQKRIVAFIVSPFKKTDLPEILGIRKKIELKNIRKDNNILDIKVSEGGMVDIEFMSQVIKLICADRNKGVIGKSTIKTLQSIEAKKILSVADLKFLTESYYMYRNIEKYIALNNLSERYILKFNDYKNFYEFFGFSSQEAFIAALKRRMLKVRNIFNSFFKKAKRYT